MAVMTATVSFPRKVMLGARESTVTELQCEEDQLKSIFLLPNLQAI